MFLRDEENLALRRIRVSTPLQAAARNRAAALVPLGAAALAGGRGEDTDDACHQATSLISAAAPLVQRDRPRRCDVERFRRAGGRNRRRVVAAREHVLRQPLPLGAEDEDGGIAELEFPQRPPTVRHQPDSPSRSLTERDSKDRAGGGA